LSETDRPRYVFREGDHALIIDRRGRRYLLQLRSSATFHSHLGTFAHDTLISQNEGARITTSKGHVLLAVKPTMAEFTRQMPRIATVVYPKDLGAIITYGDIFPGARVLEAGTGSGALTIALTRAVGERGEVTSYDVRPDMMERALENVGAMLLDHSRLTIKQGDVYQGFEEEALDRIVLDLPEPWHVVPHASRALVPGGILVSFLPTVLQFHDLTKALRADKGFDMIETIEVLKRPWSVGGRSVRPAQRMVSHTGFITTARRCSPPPGGSPPGPGDELDGDDIPPPVGDDQGGD
jgi:tRNA (adenine57-N1/adenine58-N1)-methyltransferase